VLVALVALAPVSGLVVTGAVSLLLYHGFHLPPGLTKSVEDGLGETLRFGFAPESRQRERGGGTALAEASCIGWTKTARERTDMRVVVDFDLCESNAVCMGIAPEVFEVRDDNFLYILQEEPPEELRPKVEEAVRRCPRQAISVEG
jgi:ferredoxin